MAIPYDHSETCPGCGGEIRFYPGDVNLITVYFECDNEDCDLGKIDDAERALIRDIEAAIAAKGN